MKAFIITLICLILGTTTVFRSCSRIQTYARARAWPTVSGEVYGSDVITVSKGSKWNRYAYRPLVNYRFEVNGKRYHGVRVELSDEAISSKQQASQMLLRYPLHGTVPVHYDPEDPEASCLEIGPSAGGWWSIGAGLLLMGYGVYLARQLWLRLYSDDLRTPLRHHS